MANSFPKTKEEVLKYIKDNDIYFVEIWFTDVLGYLKSFTITAHELEKALRQKDIKVARMFATIVEPNGKPFDGDPRNVLKKKLKKAKDMGFTYYVGPELEFFYIKSPRLYH
jgi:glutamine synthetase